MNISAAVLAGGESRRMGRDKALVEFDGRPLIVHVAGRLREWSDDVFVVGKLPNAQLEGLAPFPWRVVDDHEEVQTPLAGILAALRAARHAHVFVCATDMPFVSSDVVALLASRTGGVDAVAPTNEGTLEPLHALWSTHCVSKLQRIWDDGERSVHGALNRLDVRLVDVPETRSFTNLNTQEDLDALR